MKQSIKNLIIGLFFIFGLILANSFNIQNKTALIFSAVFLFLYIVLKNQKYSFIFLAFLFCALGILRFNATTINWNDDSKIWFYNSHGFEFNQHTKYKYQGIIIFPSDIRIDHQKIKVKATQLLEPTNKVINGNILVKAWLYPLYNYGDKIEITSYLIKPEPIEDFKYDKYLSKDNIYSLGYSARIRLLEKNKANPILQIIYNLRQSISNQINKIWPEPTSAFTNSLLLGYKRAMSEDIKDEFRRAGVSHVIVISGLHVTLIVLLFSKILYSTGLNRKQNFYALIFLLAIFIFLSGISASTIRASLMGLIVLLSQNIGRIIQKHLILLYTAILILLINPLLLFYDLGFQLSFLATIGLIYLSPIIQNCLKFLPEKLNIQSTFVSSCSAIIMTLPLTIYQFKKISILAPFANLLVLPLIPINMLFGFITIILSYISFQLAKYFGFIQYCLTKILFLIVKLISSIKFSSLIVDNFSIFALILSYLIIIIFFVYAKQK